MKLLPITKRETYLLKTLFALFFLMLGMFFNYNVMLNNNGMMPVYTEKVVNFTDDYHFAFFNKSEVTFFYLTDIFHTTKNTYSSLGDFFVWGGTLFIFYFLIRWTILFFEVKRRKVQNGHRKNLP